MRKSVRCAMRILIVPLLGFAQAAAALSLLDIIEMSRNGYSESEIGRIVDVTGARFEIDAVGMVALREAEVADALIERMLDEGGLLPNEVSEMTARELLELHEAGISEGMLLKYVRHRNVCAPLSGDGVHLLEREEFTPEFFDAFAELVAACERAQVARTPIEPLPEGAYAGVRGPADDPSEGDPRHHDTQYNTYSNTVYHYDHYGYDRYHDYYHPAFLYSYYHYDPRRRVYPIYLYRDHRVGDRRAHDRRDRDRQGGGQRPSPRNDIDPPEERSDSAAPRTASRLFDKPRPYMGGRPGSATGGALPSDSPRNRSPGTVPVPGGPVLVQPAATSPSAVPAVPRVPGGVRVQAPGRNRAATPSPVVPRAPAVRTARPTQAVPAVPGSTPRSVPVRRRHVEAPVRATPRAVSPRPVTRPVPAPRVAPNATPARPLAVPRAVAPRPAPARRAEPVRRSVAPGSPVRAAPRRVTPSRSVPRVVAPAPAAPRAVAPRAPRPRAVAPRAVAPRTPGPRAVAPRAVAPRAAPPPRAVRQRSAAPPQRQAAPRMPRQAPRVTPPRPKRRVER